VGSVDGPDEHHGPWPDPAVGELDTGQVVVLDDEQDDRASHDGDASGVELGLVVRRRVVHVGEVTATRRRAPAHDQRGAQPGCSDTNDHVVIRLVVHCDHLRN
jgi:hypothetical protein